VDAIEVSPRSPAPGRQLQDAARAWGLAAGRGTSRELGPLAPRRTDYTRGLHLFAPELRDLDLPPWR
jgi:hypothetical protein